MAKRWGGYPRTLEYGEALFLKAGFVQCGFVARLYVEYRLAVMSVALRLAGHVGFADHATAAYPFCFLVVRPHD